MRGRQQRRGRLDRSRYDDDYRWKLSLLRTFLAEHAWADLRRETVVPPGVRLYSWVHNRRQDYRTGRIPDWLVPELEALPGWSWRPKRDRMRANIDTVRTFVRAHGWAGITRDSVADGLPLWEWVANRRQERRDGRLAPWIARALQAIPGWTWEPRRSRYDRNLRVLRQHVARHGWAAMAQDTRAKTGEPIGRWVNHVRVRYRAGELPDDLAAELERIPGWQWEPRGARDARNLALLQRFVRRRGKDALRKTTVVDGVQLGAWYMRCGERLRRGTLPRELNRALAAIDPARWRRKRVARAAGQP